MTAKLGFGLGIVVGLIVTLIATGQVVVVTFTDTFRNVAYLVLFIIFLSGLAVTANKILSRSSLINPTADGFIAGFAFVEAIIVFLLYGRFA